MSLRVLIAEDEQQLARVLTAALQSINYEVTAVENGSLPLRPPKKMPTT